MGSPVTSKCRTTINQMITQVSAGNVNGLKQLSQSERKAVKCALEHLIRNDHQPVVIDSKIARKISRPQDYHRNHIWSFFKAIAKILFKSYIDTESLAKFISVHSSAISKQINPSLTSRHPQLTLLAKKKNQVDRTILTKNNTQEEKIVASRQEWEKSKQAAKSGTPGAYKKCVKVLAELFRDTSISDEAVLKFLQDIQVKPNRGFFTYKKLPTPLAKLLSQARPQVSSAFTGKPSADSPANPPNKGPEEIAKKAANTDEATEEAKPLKHNFTTEQIDQWLFGKQAGPAPGFPASQLAIKQKGVRKQADFAPKTTFSQIKMLSKGGKYTSRMAIYNGSITDIKADPGQKVAVGDSNNGDLLTGCGYAIATAVINAAGPNLQRDLYNRFGVPAVMQVPEEAKQYTQKAYGGAEGRGYAITCDAHDMKATHNIARIEFMTVPMHDEAGVRNMYREAFEHSKDLDYIVMPMAGMSHPVLSGKPQLSAQIATEEFQKFADKYPKSSLKVVYTIYQNEHYENLYKAAAKKLDAAPAVEPPLDDEENTEVVDMPTAHPVASPSIPKVTPRAWIEKANSFDPSIPSNTAWAYKSPSGGYKKERQKVHAEIQSQIIGKAKPIPSHQKPVALIMMGPPGAGKSMAIGKITNGSDQFVEVGMDNVMERIPEYKKAINLGKDKNGKIITAKDACAITRDEANDITTTLRKEVIASRLNMIYDGTGQNLPLYTQMIAKLKSEGYDVQVYYLDIDVEQAKERARDRAERIGRLIPDSVIENIHKNAKANFRKIAELSDTAFLLDNRSPPPKQVCKYENGVLTEGEQYLKQKGFLT